VAANKTAGNSKKTAPGRPFKPGQSGNPSGRPKGSSEFRKVVEAYLESKLDPKTTRLQDCLERLRHDKPEVLLHYAYGKPVELVDVQSTSTIVGLPNDILGQLREYAKSL
jgi:hypothetical protein